MDKGLNVPKWLLKVRPKIPQLPQNLSAQFVCPSPKVWDFDEKRLHWASVVRGCTWRTEGHEWPLFLLVGIPQKEWEKKEKKNTFLIKSCSLFQEHFTDMTSLLTGRRTVRSEYSAIAKQDSEPAEPSGQIAHNPTTFSIVIEA